MKYTEYEAFARRPDAKAAIDGLMKKLTDEGKLIEAGWMAMRISTLPPETPDYQVDDMRAAFFAGAQHLFASIMGVLDDGQEPTKADLRRMDLIANELQTFIEDYKLRHLDAEGGKQ